MKIDLTNNINIFYILFYILLYPVAKIFNVIFLYFNTRHPLLGIVDVQGNITSITKNFSLLTMISMFFLFSSLTIPFVKELMYAIRNSQTDLIFLNARIFFCETMYDPQCTPTLYLLAFIASCMTQSHSKHILFKNHAISQWRL